MICVIRELDGYRRDYCGRGKRQGVRGDILMMNYINVTVIGYGLVI